MSSLFVYHHENPDVPLKVLNHLEDIVPTLAQAGIAFERWPVETSAAPGSSRELIASTCHGQLGQLAKERNLHLHDLTSLDGPAQPGEPRFAEHRCEQAETLWFVAGRGLVYVHLGECVYAVLGEKHDLISLPAGATQWLDAGDNPRLVAIRLCAGGQAAQPQATGGDLARRFPRLEY